MTRSSAKRRMLGWGCWTRRCTNSTCAASRLDRKEGLKWAQGDGSLRQVFDDEIKREAAHVGMGMLDEALHQLDMRRFALRSERRSEVGARRRLPPASVR